MEKNSNKEKIIGTYCDEYNIFAFFNKEGVWSPLEPKSKKIFETIDYDNIYDYLLLTYGREANISLHYQYVKLVGEKKNDD